MVGHPAVEGRQADHPGQAQTIADAVDPQPVALQFAVEQRGDPRRGVRRLDRQSSAPVMLEAEADIGARHREAPHGVEAGAIFGARAAQELAPRRHLVEQALDPDPRPGGQSGGPLACLGAMVDLDSPPVMPRDAAVEGQSRDAGDRRQGLAAEAEAGDILDMIVGQLRGSVAFERQMHFGGRHPAAVVADLDKVEPPRREPDRDVARAGIEAVLDQLLQRARRALDHLARSDAIDEFGREPSY